jgi:NNP family nitrate/nitrite transporter-like MFS transporter
MSTIAEAKLNPAVDGKAPRIRLFSFGTPQMRAFHMSWFAFFLCFLSWFGLAPFMKYIRPEMKLTQGQVGNLVAASVSATIFARLLFGWLCDRIGPRLCYTILLVVGSVPVMCVGLAHTYQSLLWFRIGISVIGASFVITQYHTSSMFAPDVVGTANAMTGGWGNLGGGVTQKVMPLVMGAFGGGATAAAAVNAHAWRYSMLCAGIVCLLTGIAYFFLTQDTPAGNVIALRRQGRLPVKAKGGSFLSAAADHRVWLLFVIYGCCFGVELTVDNIADLYFSGSVKMPLHVAEWAAFSFGGLNLFARALGGFGSDKLNRRAGLNARVRWLFGIIFLEGLAMMLFARTTGTLPTVGAVMLFGLFVCMGCGATYAVVPFVNRKAVGAVSGIVGAGGNAAAFAAGFLFKVPQAQWSHQLFMLGAIVTACSFLAWGVRFTTTEEAADAVLQPPPHPVSLEPVVA